MNTNLHVSLSLSDDAKATHNWKYINGRDIISIHIEGGDGVSLSIVGDRDDFKRLLEPFSWTWKDESP